MTKLATLLAAFGILSGSCGVSQSQQSMDIVPSATALSTDENLVYGEITTEDGRIIQCVLFTLVYRGGLSCNWEGFNNG